jgi:hypothetical protein
MIDTTYDARTDAHGKDPDSKSATLRRYHRLLWSKPLPNGAVFTLGDTTPGAYLHHRSELGEFFLASDSVMPTFSRWEQVKPVVIQLPEADIETFQTLGYTIGGMMLFPGNRVDGKMTINGARGFTRRIADRFDLTLECIRRHYAEQASPLADVLGRYRDFFGLFEDFAGYVDFFLLDDLVAPGRGEVRFFMPFDDFTSRAVPADVATYMEFRRRSMCFIEARNRRIRDWSDARQGFARSGESLTRGRPHDGCRTATSQDLRTSASRLMKTRAAGGRTPPWDLTVVRPDGTAPT